MRNPQQKHTHIQEINDLTRSVYRLLGAAVIIIGLYLVVWGKSKDYESPEEELATTKQVGEAKDRSNLEVITIASSCK